MQKINALTNSSDASIYSPPIFEVSSSCIKSDIATNSLSFIQLTNFDQNQWLETTTRALNSINETVSGIPEGSYGVALAGSLSSVLAAFIFNLCYWRIVGRDKKLLSAVIEYETAVKSVEKIITEYWLHPFSKRYTVKNNIQEIRIQHDIAMLSEYGERVVQQIPYKLSLSPKSCKNNLADKISEFNKELFDVATSGDFQSPQRQANLKKVRKTIQLCSKMKIMLSGLKP
ncbi:hypothetical protein [Photobacterium damselae]|uniref:Uncharacterized protein n=1 Tax=Photobacterium damselae subsp. damselae TaxID=85581 RepID=A0AAD3ZWZ2_PHODD|nr:hypothetical protein [Photobacterium damselae]KAB1183560.1 hypothetical protein F6450_03755 [Photobacterium damselae subsp. damselae]UKA01587.1 hypothetical protein IHC89_13180 [Photobacterium damselae subsp. damselae]